MGLCVRARVRMRGGEGRRKVGSGLEMGMGMDVGVSVGVGVRVGFELRVGMRMGQIFTATTTIRFSPVVLHPIFDFGTQRTFKLASGFTSGLFWRLVVSSDCPKSVILIRISKRKRGTDGKREKENGRKCKKNERMRKEIMSIPCHLPSNTLPSHSRLHGLAARH